MMKKQKAIIFGAGPAGLTASYELINRTSIVPTILEKTISIGGLSRTINYKGNRIDIGGHRFFSKSDKIIDWWLKILPLEKNANLSKRDAVMLIRNRKSRIYFLGKFFDYPINFSLKTLYKLGFFRVVKITVSYIYYKIVPLEEQSLEDFFINRFGRELYNIFFKAYTEKIWDVQCNKISPEWGEQRVKSVSIAKSISHQIKQIIKLNTGFTNKNVETSLIEKFMYPKYGPGQLWEEVSKRITAKNGTIKTPYEVISITVKENKVTECMAINLKTKQKETFKGNYFLSSMPIKDLIKAMKRGKTVIPKDVWEISQGLIYRDFITVGLLVETLRIDKTGNNKKNVLDNWIYVQDTGVKLGRIQIFNNWSNSMVAKPEYIWLGLEYFVTEGDELWSMTDESMKALAISELIKIGFINKEDVVDGTVIRVEKAYPAYFGTYNRFSVVREFLDKIKNLYVIGRNGMHKYNNQDHSMLTAIAAVDNIISGEQTKENIWQVNTKEEYHEIDTHD